MNPESEEKRHREVNEAQTELELFEILDEKEKIIGDDGEVYDAQDIKTSISLIMSKKGTRKAVLINLPTDELNKKVSELYSKTEK